MPHTVETHSTVDGPFRLGEWLVVPRLNRLTRGDQSIQIELKMMDVLVCLAQHPGELVERQQLIDTVWATEFISENILTRAIAELRNALGDDARNPSFIETIHRKGYRLVAPVEQPPVEAQYDVGQESGSALVAGNRIFYLRQGKNLIGRTPEADVSIGTFKVSRLHAAITLVGTLGMIQDMNSKNGTFVDDARIEEPTSLCDGDRIRIGDTVLVYRIVDGLGSTFSDS